MYNAEDIFESLNVHHQELKLDDLVEIQKPSALEEVEEPECKERTMTDVKLTKGLGLTEIMSRCLRTLILLIGEQQQLQGASFPLCLLEP